MNRAAATVTVAALAALILVAFAPAASAHGPPAERDYETRLLVDCNDDWFAGDAGFGSNRGGYDLHSLDMREAWVGGANALVLRMILNGAGPIEIDVRLDTTAGAKSFTWTTSGSSWSGTGFDSVKKLDDMNDGDRFSIEGTVALSKLGLSIGDAIKANGATVTSTVDGDDGDAIPGTDRPALAPGPCDPQDAPTSFRRGVETPFEGPIQYLAFPTDDRCRSRGAIESKTVQAGQEGLIDLKLCNPTSSDQQWTLRILDDDGLDARFHQPGTDRYMASAEGALKADKETLIHLAIEGAAAASGAVQVELTSDLGGRIVASAPYVIEAAGSDSTTTSTPPEEEPSPAGLWLGIAALFAVAVLRRRG